MIRKLNKRGQGMSTSTIILLILGLAVLVVLILGFTSGWSAFSRIANPTNVDTVQSNCASYCQLQQKFSYCNDAQPLRDNNKKLQVSTSCEVLSKVSNFSEYGIAPCPQINCDLKCSDVTLTGKIARKALSKSDYNLAGVCQ